MRWLYESLTNESIILTIIIATVLMRAISVFGDIKSRQSSIKMQAIQPQLDKLRKKYANDPQKLNTEQQKIMKANNVSMFGGCLPMLFTLPLFFIFFAAFRNWSSEMSVRLIDTLANNEAAGVELFKSFRFLWIHNIWMPDNGFKPIVQTAAEFFGKANETLPKLLYFRENPEALQKFIELGFFVQNADGTYALAAVSDTLTETYNALVQPCLDLYPGRNNGWFLMPVLAGGTTFLSSWIMTRSQPKNDSTAGTGKLMQWLMPLMSAFFCLQYNASFAVYWTVSNICSLITSLFINAAFAKQGATEEVVKQ